MMVKDPISTPSPISEFCTIAQVRMRQLSPMVVRPRICANGSITVSIPTVTPESMVTVSGFSMVTPASISSWTLRSRSRRSTSASSTRVLMPRASRSSSICMASTGWPARVRISAMSVR